jgi:protein-tyrosine phosphatase
MGKQRTFKAVDGVVGVGFLKEPVRTSTTHPLKVDWVPRTVLGTKGRVGMTFAPGKCNEHGVTGIHRRSMDEDLARLVDERTHVLVTLMEPLELIENAMGGLEQALTERSIQWMHFPIRDLSIPTSLHGLRALLRNVRSELEIRRNVVVHCRGGHGRTGLVVACLLTDFEYEADTAIKIVRSARKGTIHNEAQADFVRLYANDRTRP